jgi:AAA family ATP:ADP antiporter
MWRRLIARLVDIRENEAPAMLLASAQFFLLLFGYFMLRPLRETMGLRGGVDEVQILFQVTVGVMVVGNLVYGTIASRARRLRLVPGVYAAVVLSLGGFLAWMLMTTPDERLWMGRVFYVWLSVVNVFSVSVFWQLLADVFTLEQSKRLFGFIGVGGTAGAIAGSSFAWQLADSIGTLGLMASASVLFLGAGAIAVVLCRLAPARDDTGRTRADDARAVGGRAWSGLTRLFRVPYLGGIGLLVLLFTIGSTLLYFEKLRIVEMAVEGDADRTRLFAGIELAGQVLTVALQVLLTGRLMKWLGVGSLLAVVPLVTVLGFGALGLFPTLAVLTVFEATRRAGNFALTKPARETLFTVVDREDKYKAKAGIDTFVYRGGDSVGTGIDMLLAKLGVPVAAVAIPVGLAGLWLARWLGRQENTRAQRRTGMLGMQPDRRTGRAGDAVGVCGSDTERDGHATIAS